MSAAFARRRPRSGSRPREPSAALLASCALQTDGNRNARILSLSCIRRWGSGPPLPRSGFGGASPERLRHEGGRGEAPRQITMDRVLDAQADAFARLLALSQSDPDAAFRKAAELA